MRGRTPKSEIRNPKEIRRPKAEGCDERKARRERQERVPPRCARRSARSTLHARRAPGASLRISAFLRASDFGIRILVLGFTLLIAQLSFSAANPSAPDEIPVLRPPHAEIPPTYWEQHGFLVVAGVVLLVALVSVAIWFLTRPKPPVVIPPEVQARKALEPLGRQTEDGALLSQVSHILRHYVTGAFKLPPDELTTTEFCRAIAGHEQIGPELSVALREFLVECDRRKFSPAAPAPPFGVVAHALKLIEQSQARLKALAQAASQPVGDAKPNPPLPAKHAK